MEEQKQLDQVENGHVLSLTKPGSVQTDTLSAGLWLGSLQSDTVDQNTAPSEHAQSYMSVRWLRRNTVSYDSEK